MKTTNLAVKALLQNDHKEFLILYKSDTEEVEPHDFDIPGGRIERGESPEEALIREIKEETNLNATIEKISRTWGFTKEDFHLIGITYLVHCEDTSTIQLSDEHSNFYRKTKEELSQGEFPKWLKEEIASIQSAF
jgi:8-oxo-dGTP pyrophosphatase MutT (NUDIX family)